MVVDSQTMELDYLGKRGCKDQGSAATPTRRDVSRLLGKFNSVSQAIPPAPLFCRALQRDLTAALGGEQITVRCSMPPVTSSLRGIKLVARTADTLERQVSHNETARYSDRVKCLPQRLGSVSSWVPDRGALGPGRREPLSRAVSSKSGSENLPEGQINKQVLLLLDNQTAVAYVNNLGGTVSTQATRLAKELWMWCLEREILLTAQHLPGKENVIADTESRVMRDRSDWMLNPSVFRQIMLSVLLPRG